MNMEDIQKQIIELQNDLTNISLVRDELWKYHPSNPDYINVIQSYKKTETIIKIIEDKILALKLIDNQPN